VPAETWQWYANFCEAYRDLPEAAWGPALRPVELAPRQTADDGRARRRRWAFPRPRLVLPSLAAAVVAVVVCLLLALGGSTVPPSAQVNGTPVVWRLAGFINAATWQPGGAPGTNAASVTCVSTATCYADQLGSLSGGTAVLTTADGGATWQRLSLPTGWRTTSPVACVGPGQCLVAASQAAGSAAGQAGTAAVLATTDGGQAWSVKPIAAGVTSLFDISCGSAADCVAMGQVPPAATGAVKASVAVVSDDGGASWTVVPLPGPFLVSGTGLACSTGQQCLAVGANSLAVPAAGGGNVAAAAMYSSDGGRTWSPATVPSTLARLRVVSCAAADHCVAIGDPPSSTANGADPYGPPEALTSADGGRSWSVAGQVTTGPLLVAALSCPSTADCWASGRITGQTDGAIEATHDGGATWAPVPLPATLTPTQQAASGLSLLQIQDVSSVSCPTSGPCLALAARGTGTGADQQYVLRGGGLQAGGT